MKKIVLRKSGQDWRDEFGNTWTLAEENKQSRTKFWTKEEEDLLREHLKSGGGFSWESTRELAMTLERTVVAVRGRLTKIRKEEKENASTRKTSQLTTIHCPDDQTIQENKDCRAFER